MKVLFLDSVHPILEKRLVKLGFTCEHDSTSSRENILKIIPKYHGLVIRSRTPLDKEFLTQASQLKFIARSGAGLENIDLVMAKSLGINLFSAPEGNRQAVGEHALGMLLSLFNKLSEADKQIRSGTWLREANRGVELAGKTVGIIGYGNMGKSFAKCISGIGCTVLAFDTHKKYYSDVYASESTLLEIQEKADIISFHTPYNPSTHHYLNRDFILNMSKPFYLLNTARGKVVCTEDLVEGLKSEKILGACLDVLEFEKTSFELMIETEDSDPFNYLIKSSKVLLSPHVAGWTQESYEKLSAVLASKIEENLHLIKPSH
jgi:D-3-phosphoglycerate dehydrogenase / 2-oxoglutarate reductase